MYATCTFCHAGLGANESLEAFPVGRRLAFDPARGRLWVVCPRCRQWNLSPLDERWEAIEAAERLYRDTKRRVATDQIGLARLRDGSDLIRIGDPLRPEFAAWRYGERFTMRWRRYAAYTALFSTGVLAVGPLTGLGFTFVPYQLWSAGTTAVRRLRVVLRLRDAEGAIVLTREHAELARIVAVPDDPLGWRLSLPHLRRETPVGRFIKRPSETPSRITLAGEDALDAMRRILPIVNADGGRRRTVDEAVRVLEDSGDTRAAFARAAAAVGRDGHGDPTRDLHGLPAPLRLALEMAAHEEAERRALEGELAALESAWKEAEEIAAIADALTVPEWMAARLGRLGGG